VKTQSYFKSKWAGSASASVIALAGCLTLGVSTASAQDSANDVIVVTGSIVRTKSQDFETPSPIQTLDQTLIKNTGAVRVQDLFKGLTVNSGSQVANRQNALQGVSQFSLRGLGIGSTLTLVNGRRAGLSPVSDATGQLFTDANAYPVNMIERIDVLTDGASATYGSEAVAGVVNVITRKNFEGAEITGEYRTSTHDSFQVGAAVGHGFDKGHFSVFGTYYNQGGNFRGDIDIINDADQADGGRAGSGLGREFSSGTGSPGRIQLADDVDGDGIFTRFGNTLPDPDCAAAGGIVDGSNCRYPFINQRRIIAEEERIQIFSQFDYEISDHIRVDAEASFSRNEITDAIGGAVLRGAANTVQNGGFLVRADNPFNFFINDGGTLRVATAAEAADPTTVYADVITRQRPLGAAFDGDCESADDFFCAADIDTVFDNLRLSGGLEFELNENWFINSSVTFADNSYVRSQPRDFDGVDFQAAIDAGLWNPFGSAIANPTGIARDGVSTFGNTPEDLLLFSNTITERGNVSQIVLESILSGTTGFELPGGPVSVAVGSQYRELGFDFTPDGRRQSGDNGRGEVESAIPRTTQDVYAIFGEAIIPATEQLEVQVALRYEDYGDQGGDTIDPKISAKFDINDQFAIRGSWGTSFQAPSIRQVSGAVGSAGVTDPLLGDAGGSFNVTVFTSGSPDLTSQSASNFNVGAIWRSDFGLDISGDFWTYNYKDLILPGGSAQSIIDADPNGPAVQRDGAGQLNAVFTGFENRGDADAQGFDINARYTPDWWSFGDMTFDASTTVVTKFESTEFAGLDGMGDLLGSRNNGNAFGSVPDFKFNLGATLSKDAHQANVSLRHIGGYTDDQQGNPIDSQTTIDARYALTLDGLFGGFLGDNSSTTFTIGAVNLFDVDAPRIEERPLFDTEVHDPRGRQFYVGFRQGF